MRKRKDGYCHTKMLKRGLHGNENRIMYRIKDEKILVLTIIHGARDLGSIGFGGYNT